MVFLERHQDVRIARAEQPRSRVLRVQCAVGQADVVEDVVDLGLRHLAADGLLHQIAELGCLLDARPALRPHMKDERSIVGGWKEVLTEKRQQRKDTQAGQQKDGHEEDAGLDQPPQQVRVPGAHPLEAAFKAALKPSQGIARRHGVGVVLVEQVHGERRHQRPRQDVRRQHGEDHRLSQRNEEVSCHAAQEKHGQKHNADAQGRDQRRDGDLCRAVLDGTP